MLETVQCMCDYNNMSLQNLVVVILLLLSMVHKILVILLLLSVVHKIPS